MVNGEADAEFGGNHYQPPFHDDGDDGNGEDDDDDDDDDDTRAPTWFMSSLVKLMPYFVGITASPRLRQRFSLKKHDKTNILSSSEYDKSQQNGSYVQYKHDMLQSV